MNFIKILLICWLVLGVSSTAKSQTEDSFDFKKLESYLKAIHQKKGFSGEILVANGMNILFQETIGLASYENNLELKKDSKYRIASISKTFTGTLIAIAQQEEKIDINDKASKYLDGLSKKFEVITIKQLLNHTSGLPHNEGIKDYWEIKSKLPMKTEQVFSEINALDLLFQPGSKMHYSSIGYYLLATILEEVYRDDFINILNIKILDKLGMCETSTVNSLKIIPKMSKGYHLIGENNLVVAPYRNYSMLKGAGDLYSSSKDLLKWNNSFFSNTFVTKETELLLSDNNRDNINYGYGWYHNNTNHNKKYHGGGTWGFSTHNTIYPEDKLSIIILCNISKLPISSIASDVEKIVYGDSFELPVLEETIESSNLNVQKYSGKFISKSNKMVLNILENKGDLYAKLGDNPPFKIYPKGNHQFVGKKIDINITFEVKDNLAVGLMAERMGNSFQFSKAIN